MHIVTSFECFVFKMAITDSLVAIVVAIKDTFEGFTACFLDISLS